MAQMNLYQLGFKASSKSNKIDVLVKAGVREQVADVLYFILDELATSISYKEIPSEDIRVFAERIIDQFAREVSISSIAHWANMIISSKPPFDGKVFWVARDLAVLLRKYLNMQKEILQRDKPVESCVDKNISFKKVIQKNPELKEKLLNLKGKLQVKEKNEAKDLRTQIQMLRDKYGTTNQRQEPKQEQL